MGDASVQRKKSFNSGKPGTLAICVEIILGEGDRALGWLSCSGIHLFLSAYRLCSCKYPFPLLQQFLLLSWITQTWDSIFLPLTTVSLIPCFAKRNRKFVFSAYCISFLPSHSLLHLLQSGFNLITSLEWSLLRWAVIYIFPNNGGSFLILLNLSAVSDTGDHFLLLKSLPAACFHNTFPSFSSQHTGHSYLASSAGSCLISRSTQGSHLHSSSYLATFTP